MLCVAHRNDQTYGKTSDGNRSKNNSKSRSIMHVCGCRNAVRLWMEMSSSARALSSISWQISAMRIRSQSPIFGSKICALADAKWGSCGRRVTAAAVTGKGRDYSSSASASPNWSDRPPVETAPLFPGCDYEHWLIVMDPPNGGDAPKQEMIDHYIKTLAKVLGSEDAAKKSIYNVSCERYYGFGCQIDEETSNKLIGLPGVQFVLPDSYVDPEHKDYGGELLVDGKIVPRPPERQRRVTPAPQRLNSDRPRYNDRTRYARRKDNMSQGR